MAQLLANFIRADKTNTRIQIGDHEIKIVSFTGNATIFFRNITCLNRTQVILRLYENAKVTELKDNFFKKPSPYGLVHTKK